MHLHDARAGARRSTPRNSPRSRRTPRPTASSRARCRRRSPSRWTPRSRPERDERSMAHRRAAQGPRRDVQSGEPLSPRAARGGRRRLGAAERRGERRRRTAAAQDDVVRIQQARTIIAPQRIAGHSVHAVDQSVPGLRARLHLLLRAAVARVPRPVAGHRLRDEALREAECRRAAARRAREARLRLRADRARHQHRSVPADRARMEGHALGDRGARRVRASADDHDQGALDRARPRSARADGGEEPRARVRLDRDARPRARAQARPARSRAAAAAARSSKALVRRRRAGRRQRRAGDSAAHRPATSRRSSRQPRPAGARTPAWMLLRLPREVAPLVPRLARRASIRCAPRT